MAFKLAIVSDVRDVLRGTKDLESRLLEVADALDDVGTDAKDAGRDIERGLDAGTKESERAVEKLERKFRDAYDAVKKDAKETGRVVERENKESFDRSSDNISEFKDEARSNFSEVASSFTGEMDSAADLVQGTLGGLAGGIAGPVGIAVGALGAVFGVMYAQAKENSENAEARVASMYEDMLESGRNYASQSYIETELNKIMTGADDAAIKYEDLAKTAEATGVRQSTVALAYAGDLESQTVLLDAVKGKLDEVQTMNAADAGTYLSDFGDALGTTLGDMERLGGESIETSEKAKLARDALAQLEVPELRVALDGAPEVERNLHDLARERDVNLNATFSQYQAQQAANEAARSIVPPTVTFRTQVGSMRPV